MSRSTKDLTDFTEKETPEMRLDPYISVSRTKRSQNREKVTIIVDNRELASDVVSELHNYGIALVSKTLDVGDFVLSERVVVERKTSNDFSASIIDGRLFSQAISLKNSYEKPLFLIEGKTLYTHRNIRPQAIMGAVSSLIIDYEIPIVWTRTAGETALLLFSIARREQVGEKRPLRVRSEKKPPSLCEVQQYIVAGLPFVETTLAKRLLKAFGTIEEVFSASERDLQNVDGIGKKKSHRIREVVSAKYREDES